MDKGFHPLGESVIDSNPFWFRVVRVFRGSICFFRDDFREMGSTRAARVVFGALAEHIVWGCSSQAVAEAVRIPVGGGADGCSRGVCPRPRRPPASKQLRL